MDYKYRFKTETELLHMKKLTVEYTILDIGKVRYLTAKSRRDTKPHFSKFNSSSFL